MPITSEYEIHRDICAHHGCSRDTRYCKDKKVNINTHLYFIYMHLHAQIINWKVIRYFFVTRINERHSSRKQSHFSILHFSLSYYRMMPKIYIDV